MAAVTIAAIAAGVSAYGAAAQGDAALAAGKVNAQNSEYNAEMSIQQAAEDERRFRIASRKQLGANKVAAAGAGIQLTGSALDVLEENSRNMESDAQAIKEGGANRSRAFQREGSYSIMTSRSQSQAANTSAASNLLSGASNAYTIKKRGY